MSRLRGRFCLDAVKPVNTSDFQWKSIGWNKQRPQERNRPLGRSILMPFASTHNELPFCLLFVLCGLDYSHDDPLHLMQPSWYHCALPPSLRCSSLNAYLIRHYLCQAPFSCFDLISPVQHCLLTLTGSVPRRRIDPHLILS